jgi:hypothetical protein
MLKFVLEYQQIALVQKIYFCIVLLYGIQRWNSYWPPGKKACPYVCDGVLRSFGNMDSHGDINI